MNAGGFATIAKILAVTLLTGAVLFGCAGRSSFPPFKNSRQDQAQELSVPALGVLAWHSTPADDEALQTIIDSLNTLNPSIEITVTLSADYDTDLAAALASDSPPDVFLVTGSMLPELVAGGAVAPVPDGWIDEGQLLRAAAAGVTIQNKLYCFPHAIHTLALVYNLDRFEDAGIGSPTSAWGWDDLASAAARLTDEETGAYGLVLDPNMTTWIPFYLQAGGTMKVDTEGNARMEKEPAQSAALFFAQLFANGVAATPSALEAAWAGEAFAEGNATMTVAGDWIIPYLASRRPAFTYRTAELPAGPAGKATVAFVNCVAVYADSPERDLSFQLAAQLTAPEVLRRWAGGEGTGLSVYIDQGVAQKVGRPEYDAFLRGLRYAQPWQLGRVAADHAELFVNAVEMIVDGDLTPDEFWPYLLRRGVFAISD